MEKQISSWSVTFLLHDPWWHLTWIRIRLFILVDLIPEIQNSIWKTDKILDEISFRIFYWKLKTVPDPGSGPMIFMDTEPTGSALWRVHAKAGLPKHWDINVRLNYSLELTVKIMKQSVENVDLGDPSAVRNTRNTDHNLRKERVLPPPPLTKQTEKGLLVYKQCLTVCN